MDYNDVVVHIFLERVRSFYDLEGLWAEAPHTEVAEKIRQKVGAKADKPAAKKKGS